MAPSKPYRAELAISLRAKFFTFLQKFIFKKCVALLRAPDISTVYHMYPIFFLCVGGTLLLQHFSLWLSISKFHAQTTPPHSTRSHYNNTYNLVSNSSFLVPISQLYCWTFKSSGVLHNADLGKWLPTFRKNVIPSCSGVSSPIFVNCSPKNLDCCIFIRVCHKLGLHCGRNEGYGTLHATSPALLFGYRRDWPKPLL